MFDDDHVRGSMQGTGLHSDGVPVDDRLSDGLPAPSAPSAAPSQSPNGYRDVLMTNLPYCGSKRSGTGGPLSRGQLVFGYSTPLGCVQLPAAELESGVSSLRGAADTGRRRGTVVGAHEHRPDRRRGRRPTGTAGRSVDGTPAVRGTGDRSRPCVRTGGAGAAVGLSCGRASHRCRPMRSAVACPRHPGTVRAARARWNRGRRAEDYPHVPHHAAALMRS